MRDMNFPLIVIVFFALQLLILLIPGIIWCIKIWNIDIKTITRSQKIVEMQGTAEHAPINWNDFDEMKGLAVKGATDIFSFYDENQYSMANSENKLSNMYVPSYRDMMDYM